MQDISSRNNESRRYIKSSSFIMALLFTVLCGAAALSLGYFINYFAKGHFVHSTEAVIDSELRYIEAVGIQDTQGKERFYAYLNEDGSLPAELPSSISLLSEGIIVFDHPERKRRYAAKIHTFEDGKKLLVGTDITAISHDFKFMQWLGIASIVFVVVVVFVSYLISVFVVSGTNKIADTAREIIKTGDLSRRVELGSRWDDLSNMAAVLNLLLDRIEELMIGVKQVSDNIAHDLRTPLTRMRNKIESLSDSEQKQTLIEESDNILSTFNALLRISRLETEKQRSQFSQVNLKDIVCDVAEFYEPLAEERGITLQIDVADALITGDRDLLFQAYANILDNALKFTPENRTIEITLLKDSNIEITFKDSGSGVPENEIGNIFDRFYRGEKSRSSSGTGLGLSLVKAVIELHDGRVKAQNTDTGLQIITVF